jgi:NAD+ synthase (glutamine-hydrolysing)
MKNIRVGAAVVNLTPMAWDHNTRLLLESIEEARREGVTVLCLPEMCIPGYGCQDAFFSPSVQSEALGVLFDDIAPATRGMVVSVGLPLVWRNAIFNAVALIVDGEVAGFICKRFLAGDGVHYEPRWFKPWPTGARGTVTLRGRDYPIGDHYFDVGGVRIGFEICEDAWVAQRPGTSLTGRGVDLILNPSASHFAFGKLAVRKRFVIEGSRAFGVTYVYSNLLGCDEGRIIYDGGALIATQGRLIAMGPRLGMELRALTHGIVDVEQTRMMQGWTNSFRPHFEEIPGECVRVPFEWPAIGPQAPAVLMPTDTGEAAWERSAHLKEEEFWRAETLGLFDYLRKSYSRGYVISLSGGADSAACTVLVALMVERAIAELGMEGFKARLAHDRRVQAATTPREAVRALLTTAYQATQNSGDVTRNAARAIADAVGAEHHELDVDALVRGYVGILEGALGRALTWDQDDVALQNIQARARAPGIWMFANIRGALLIATSNRSEAAVGYTTMDGDTAGGLSPIAGIDKAFLRRWLAWMETSGPVGGAPLPALAAITAQAPTAELRPQEKKQTDEDDLMPYALLDAVEGAAIRDKQDPIETFELMRAQFPEYGGAQLGLWIKRFFRLWSRNQWKRERFAPSFHLDDKNLDPKTWCRYPILSGGFDRELAALDAHIASLSETA